MSGVERFLGGDEQPDGRLLHLPRPAVNLAQRLTQLAQRDELVTAQVVILRGEWYLQYQGRSERLGTP